MATEVFVDASFWTALLYQSEERHSQTRVTWQEIVSRRWATVTTNWTVYETLTFLNCSRNRYDLAIEALEFINRRSQIVHIEEAGLENRSLEIFPAALRQTLEYCGLRQLCLH